MMEIGIYLALLMAHPHTYPAPNWTQANHVVCNPNYKRFDGFTLQGKLCPTVGGRPIPNGNALWYHGDDRKFLCSDMTPNYTGYDFYGKSCNNIKFG